LKSGAASSCLRAVDRGPVATSAQVSCLGGRGPKKRRDLLVRCLEHEGVTAYSNPGERNPLTDALASSSIRYVLVRHEQAASFMAEIFGRLLPRWCVLGDPRSGRHQPPPRTADATTNSTRWWPSRPGWAQPHLQESTRASIGVDVLPGDQVGGSGPHPRGSPRDGSQGVQAGSDRASRAVYLAVPEDIEAMVAPDELVPLDLNIPRPDEPHRRRSQGRPAVLNGARHPIVLAGHGAARTGAAAALRRFSEQLGVRLPPPFTARCVPDDHPHALGAVGFMSHDYVNFGFDERTSSSVSAMSCRSSILCGSTRRGQANPPLSRFPAEVDAHYDVEVGVQADLSRTLDALAAATTRRFAMGPSGERIRRLLAGELAVALPTTASAQAPADRVRHSCRP